MMIDKSQSNVANMFINVNEIHKNYDEINRHIKDRYKLDQLREDDVLKQIFQLMAAQPPRYDIEAVRLLAESIPENSYLDCENFVQEIANEKIKQKLSSFTALDVIMSLHCYISLECSSSLDFFDRTDLSADVDNFLLNDQKCIYLLMGKSGAGKSLFLLNHYRKMQWILNNIQFRGADDS